VLELRNGSPRLYLMRLPPRPLHFTQFARHNKVTQCLAGLGTTPWYMAVAPPPASGEGLHPEVPVDSVLLFEFRPPTAVCLRQGCWHSGPYFTDDGRDFYNLEMTDTNVVDYNPGRTRDRHSFTIDLGQT
jgi:hypothetical protein